MDYGKLLYGSQELTDEEESVRVELIAWCQAKLDQGIRPIPLQAATMIVSDMLSGAWGEGVFTRPNRATAATNDALPPPKVGAARGASDTAKNQGTEN